MPRDRRRSGGRALARGLSAVLIAALAPWGAANADDETPIRILFIGNSLTGCNDMPAVFQRLAESAGQAVAIEECIMYGSSLEDRFWWDAVQSALGRDWDYVVLQEYSSRPLDDPEAFRRSVAEYAAALDGRAQIVLFENWPWYGEPSIDQLDAIYAEVALEFGAIVAPLGRAWATVTTDSSTELYVDYAHPTPAGTYLGACVFYATLFGCSPQGLTHDALYDSLCGGFYAGPPLGGDFFDLALWPQRTGATDVDYLQWAAWQTAQGADDADVGPRSATRTR